MVRRSGGWLWIHERMFTWTETSKRSAIDEMAESNADMPLGKEAELAAEAGNVGSFDLRVGVDRQPAPVTDVMMTNVPPLPERIFVIVKPPSKGGDAPDEGATAAGYGDTGELAAMSAPFSRVGHRSAGTGLRAIGWSPGPQQSACFE